MSSPPMFQGLFDNKQRSYKMVLVLSMLEETNNTVKAVPLTTLAQRFQNYYISREQRGTYVEPPPNGVKRWAELSAENVRSVILANPLPRLGKTLAYDKEKDLVSFHPDAEKELTPEGFRELKKYAEDELNAFYRDRRDDVKVSLRAPERQGIDTLPKRTVKEYVEEIKAFIRSQGFNYSEPIIENFYLSLKTKPFVILAGVSGTGKTKLVKLFAQALGATAENGRFVLIPVRPDWSDPTDLLGYKDLSGVFRPGKLIQVFREASQAESRDKPFFICLDEMNLARVEHYFSDILSILETQRWTEEGILTGPVLTAQVLEDHDQEEWEDLRIPDNVYLIGTVNMDETTHPFSKKVLDRASTIEFNEINLKTMPLTEGSDNVGERLDGPLVSNDMLRSEYLILADAYQKEELRLLINRTVDRLVQINEILETIHAHIGFRVRDNVCFYLAYNSRFGLLTEDEGFDLQILQKILPRVQGSSLGVKRTLIELMFLATGNVQNREEMLEDASPLYLPWGRSGEAPKVPYPHTARKLAFMLRRFEEDGFTSFWLS